MCSRSLCWTPPEGAVRGFWGEGKTHKTAVHFGDHVIHEVPTDLYRRPLFPGEDGLLGTALLSRFESVWIDAAKRQIVFDPLLPPPLVDVGERRAFIETMKTMDREGRRIWKRFFAFSAPVEPAERRVEH